MTEKSKDVNRLWRSYQQAVEASGVPEGTAERYVRWAQKFAISIKGKPLYFFTRRCWRSIQGSLVISSAPSGRKEAQKILDALSGIHHVMAGLLYGSGLRLMECVRLRVKDVDFETHRITVRDGKEKKDRLTMLPKAFVQPLQEQLVYSRALYDRDMEEGTTGVYIWPALARKYPGASKEWIWQYVFPSDRLSVDPRTRVIRRHHIHENSLQSAVKMAAQKARLTKKVGPHTLRNSFATHASSLKLQRTCVLEAGYDIPGYATGEARAGGQPAPSRS